MRIGILGTGAVGRALGTAFVARGHEVRLGSRSRTHEAGAAWARENGDRARLGTFAEAAVFGEFVVHAAKGDVALDVIGAAGAENLRGKVLVDTSNPLDFSRGFPPALFTSGHDSLGERIQRAFPDVRVVKALNTVANQVMVNPSLVPGHHDLFICGDDADAKAFVEKVLRDDFGWQSIVDLGGIDAARATEAMILVWTRLWRVVGSERFNFRVVRG